jgi:hypothetical protein
MKKAVFIFLAAAFAMSGTAQNGFANQSFYDAYKKISAAAGKGFDGAKGPRYNTRDMFYTVYQTAWLLPGADSGKIFIPSGPGISGAVFYFKPATTIARARQMEQDLLVAVKSIYNKPLYQKKQQDTANGALLYHNYFYDSQETGKSTAPVFRTTVAKEKGWYIVSLTVSGKSPAKTPVTGNQAAGEPGLDEKIKLLLQDMDQLFAQEKLKEVNKTAYYTLYESRSAILGVKGNIKDREFEVSFSLQKGYPGTSGPADARKIYEQFKTIFTNSGKFLFKEEVKEGSRTWVYGYDAISKPWAIRYTLVLEYYDSPTTASVGFLLTRKK